MTISVLVHPNVNRSLESNDIFT